MNIKEKLMKTMLELALIPGISGTESENLASQKICDILANFRYFTENPNNLNIIKVENDPLNRSFVAALFRSKKFSRDTIILNSHFDVVGIEEFGHLKDIAFDPIEITKRINELQLHTEALKDLESGDYIFGRGTADMKFGIALHIEILRWFTEREDFCGNILLLAVPGEESNSEGMLAAAPYLAGLQEKLQLNFTGVLVSECSLPKKPFDENRYLYLGTVGKVMPLFFFVGKESHVCEPFNSISPNLLASEVNKLFEYNAEFCDTALGEVSPPPVCLKQMDLKELYSVKVPLYSAAYYNLLTLNASSEELIEKLKKLCTKAFENALEIIYKNQKYFEKITNTKNSSVSVTPSVLTFEELYREVKTIYAGKFEDFINERIISWKNEKLDNQKIAINLIREVYEKYPYKRPMIIIGFAPPYYPDKHINMDKEKHAKFMEAVNNTLELSMDKYNISLKKDNFFMGICDLSYTGLSRGQCEGIDKISSNLACSKTNYNLPVDALKKLDIPGAVFGGLGKDLHKYTERLNISYSFNVVPDLYENLIYKLLG